MYDVWDYLVLTRYSGVKELTSWYFHNFGILFVGFDLGTHDVCSDMQNSWVGRHLFFLFCTHIGRSQYFPLTTSCVLRDLGGTPEMAREIAGPPRGRVYSFLSKISLNMLEPYCEGANIAACSMTLVCCGSAARVNSNKGSRPVSLSLACLTSIAPSLVLAQISRAASFSQVFVISCF